MYTQIDSTDSALESEYYLASYMSALREALIEEMQRDKNVFLFGLDVDDQPGVLHAITGVFANHGVSIRAAEQEGIGEGARLVFVTHRAREADVQACVSEFRKSSVVKRASGLIRVIGE